ncbi:MAG: ShlB/FhaC/HecB family hemolysin secretion/activation protein [Hormoscilla sp.]
MQQMQTTPNPSAEAEQPIAIERIEVVGSTIFGPDILDPIVQPLLGRSVTLKELTQTADRITQLYLKGGFINSRAIIPDQEIIAGIVQIRVIEGSLESIEVEGTRKINPEYIRSRVRLGVKMPLNTADIEEQLRLLNTNPLFENVEASLRAGGDVDRSILVVRVTEAKHIDTSLFVDNYSPPTIGSERFGGTVRYRNLIGIGDELAGSYSRTTTGGADVYSFDYRVPLNARDGTLSLTIAGSRNHITAPEFQNVGIRGKSRAFDITYQQPLLRNLRSEFAISVGLSHQSGQTFLFDNQPFGFGFGPDDDGNSTTSVVKLGTSFLHREVNGAWALRSQFSFGTGLLDATINPEPIPDGRFFSWFFSGRRVQRLGADHLLILQADLQLTPDSLLPSQQFLIGGGQSLRGYRQNARAGDNGFRLSIEDRITVGRDDTNDLTVQLIPFVDLGMVWNKFDNPNSLPEQTFLASFGLGLAWQPLPGVDVRFDYALPFVVLDDRGNNAQDRGFYFSINFQL